MRLKRRMGPGDERAPEARRPWTESLHVWVVVSFAVAQPLYDLLGKQAEFFVFQNAGRAEILGLVVVLSGLVPLALVAGIRLAGLAGPRTERGVHYTVMATGVALTVLPALRPVEAVPGISLVYAALVLGWVVAVLYARFGAVRLFFTLLAPAVVVFPVVFVAASPVTPLLVREERTQAQASATIERPAPIVFVIFDEFPTTSLMDGEERIDAQRYPNFAALARSATWYRRATTVGESTYDALPAILSGRYPRPGRLPNAFDHPQNLFTLLAGTYEMHTAGALTQLCPEGLCAREDDGGVSQRLPAMLSDLGVVYPHLLLGSDLRALLPSVTDGWKGFGQVQGPMGRWDEHVKHVEKRTPWRRESRWEDGGRFIGRMERTDRPTLWFMHLMLPHHRYEYLPSGRRYNAKAGMPGVVGENLGERKYVDDPENVHRLYQRHLLQVGAVDTWLGDLVERLREVGLFDEALLVVTADHGISFRAGEPYRLATEKTFQDILAVPLFIKAPFQNEGRVEDRPTRTIDIVPTVADLIEARLPWQVDGKSVFEPGPAPARETRLHRWPDLKPATFTGLAEAMGCSARRRHALFGSGPWYPGLYVRGPHRALIGKSIGELSVGETAGVRVTLDHADTFTEVDARSGFVPAHITGGVTEFGKDHPSISLAVAVNGAIEAVTEPWKPPIGGREGSWSAIVPETAFRIGENTVEVFLIAEAGGKVRLSRAAPSG